MSPVLAGIGVSQMMCIEDNIISRRSNNQFYVDLFKKYKGITVLNEPSSGYYSNHWLTCILIDTSITGFTREDLRLQLEKEHIESRPMWKPMHQQPVFNTYPYYGKHVAETLFRDGLCLPSGSNLTNADRARIAASINMLL